MGYDIADGPGQGWLDVVLAVFVSCAAVDIDSAHAAAVKIPAMQGLRENVANGNVGPVDFVRIYLGQA
jgi:hypothetical protein